MDFIFFLQLICIIIFAGLGYLALDQYKLYRERKVEDWRRQGLLPPPAAGPDTSSKGELSTAAKYAIWNYMFSILAVGGAVIGIVAGIAGYMIKDLATERAIQTALNKMQEPLAEQLKKFASADVALTTAVERTKDDGFAVKVANVLKGAIAAELPPKVAQELFDKHSKVIVNAVASELATNANYVDAIRGKTGAPGKDGPTVAEVTAALMTSHKADLRGKDGSNGKDGSPGKDGPSTTDVVATLMKSHAADLRGKDGSNGKDGVNGKDGSPGKDGPSTAEVVAGLMKDHATELRGKDGSDGKDGVNGKDGKDGLSGKDGPGVAEVAAALMKSHSAELRGRDGENGKDGTDGKDGVNGRDGVSPEPGAIAELVVNRYREQLRGPAGTNGTNGSNGQSPKPNEVAAALWESHREEISRQKDSRKRSR